MTLPIDQIIANSEDAARLKQAGIVSLDDFWQARTVKTNLLSALFPNDPEASRRVFSQMAEAGRAEAANLAAPWLRRLWPDFVVLLAVGLFLYGLLRDRPSPTQVQREQVVVAAKGGVPAYHVVTMADVVLQKSAAQEGSSTSVADVLGRVSTASLAEGTVLTSDKLSRGRLPAPLENRALIQLKLQPTALVASSSLPATVSLFASPRIAGVEKARVFKDMIILSLSPQTDGSVLAVVAVQENDEEALAALLAVSDFVATVPAP